MRMAPELPTLILDLDSSAADSALMLSALIWTDQVNHSAAQQQLVLTSINASLGQDLGTS